MSPQRIDSKVSQERFQSNVSQQQRYQSNMATPPPMKYDSKVSPDRFMSTASKIYQSNVASPPGPKYDSRDSQERFQSTASQEQRYQSIVANPPRGNTKVSQDRFVSSGTRPGEERNTTISVIDNNRFFCGEKRHDEVVRQSQERHFSRLNAEKCQSEMIALENQLSRQKRQIAETEAKLEEEKQRAERQKHKITEHEKRLQKDKNLDKINRDIVKVEKELDFSKDTKNYDYCSKQAQEKFSNNDRNDYEFTVFPTPKKDKIMFVESEMVGPMWSSNQVPGQTSKSPKKDLVVSIPEKSPIKCKKATSPHKRTYSDMQIYTEPAHGRRVHMTVDERSKFVQSTVQRGSSVERRALHKKFDIIATESPTNLKKYIREEASPMQIQFSGQETRKNTIRSMCCEGPCYDHNDAPCPVHGTQNDRTPEKKESPNRYVVTRKVTDPIPVEIVLEERASNFKISNKSAEMTEKNTIRDILLENFESSLKDIRELEVKRSNLALRFDFCLTELMSQIDTRKTGYVNLPDICAWSKKSNVSLNKEDWARIVDRFDKDMEGYICYTELIEIFAPSDERYRKEMLNRAMTGVDTFSKYTVQTRKLVKDFFYSLVTILENFEANQFRISGGLASISSVTFDFFDLNNDGLITFEEFYKKLKKSKLKYNKTEIFQLFEMFDMNKNGVISFNEFFGSRMRDDEKDEMVCYDNQKCLV